MASATARLVFVLGLSASLPPSSAGAQSARPAPQLTCDGLATATRIWESKDDDTIQAVTKCLNELKDEVGTVSALPVGKERTGRIIALKARFKRYTGWLPDREANLNGPSAAEAADKVWTNSWLAAATAKDQARDRLNAVLSASNLFAKFSAVLVSAVALVDTNESTAKVTAPGTSTPAATTPAAAAPTPLVAGADTSTAGLGNIIWQSRHVGDSTIRKWGLEISAGGRIGMQPVLSLVVPDAAPATGTATSSSSGDAATTAPAVKATPSAVHQNAFVWTAGLQVHLPVSQLDSEFTLFGNLGSAVLTTSPKVLGTGMAAQLSLPLDAGTSRNAWRWESGIQFSVFDNELDQIHAEGGMLTPQLLVAVAWRRDRRFADASDFTSPADRLLFRFTLDAIRVLDKRQVGDSAKNYTFGFAVERERGFGARAVPTATRYLLRGDVNLLNAVANAGTAKVGDTPSTAWTAPLTGSPQLALAGKPSKVTVALKGLKGAQDESVTPTPAPTVEVTDVKADGFALPTCPGARILLSLRAGVLTLTTEEWGRCQAKTVDLTVTPK